MASGSSGRNSGFDFGGDDVLGSYNDFSNQETSNGDPVHGTNSTKDFRDGRMGRPALVPVYSQSDESARQELISTVEKTMKKYADNLLRFLEGISARLSQLELYCYNLEKSVGEMRSDVLRENREADSKLSSLEKHLQEVHRSIQILRDKQELADTQKELAKLQLVHKEEVVTPSTSDPKKLDNPPEVQKQQLALALPHQVSPPTPLPPPMSHPPQIPSQPTYYPQQTPVPTPPMPSQLAQDRYMQADPQYQRSQLQISQPPPPPPSQPQQQSQPMPSYPSYQQQWSQQYPQQPSLQSQHQPSPQTQLSQQAPPPTYAPYPPPNQSVNPPPPEVVNYGYGGGANRPTVQQPPPPLQQRPQPPQANQSSYGAPLNDSTYPRQGYMVYEGESGRMPPPSHFPQGPYPPPNPVRHPSPSQMMRNTPYNELAEKAVSMGYGRDFVLSVIHSMEESGQPMDFNSLLDRLNMHSSGGSQRTWSG